MARILVVDDYADFRLLLRHMLEPEGHSVREASDGQAALALLQQEPFDLVITDVLMPQSDGIEVLNALRRSATGMPVIVTSGGGSTMNAEMALELGGFLGAHAMLRKPVRRQELLAAVAAALAAPKPGAAKSY
ncbi:response regulator [Ferrovibrio sp.]|uniref:response regulator n=1 Tax=Ferrovibrio sp. TaxID=1917215 RepID=UPI003D27A401